MDLVINESYPKLNDIDPHILHFTQTNPKLCTAISIVDLAREYNVSTATVLRTTQKLDFSGHNGFKFFLKNNAEKISVSTPNMIEIIGQDIPQTIKLFKQNRKIDEIRRITDKSDNIYIHGTGHGQRLMLQEFAHCFLNVGRNVIPIPSLTELEIIKKFTRETDLLFIVSWSDNIDKYRDTLINLEVLGIPMISITCLNNNDLSAMSKYNFYFRSSIMDKDMNINRSSYLTLHLIPHLPYDDCTGYTTCKI